MIEKMVDCRYKDGIAINLIEKQRLLIQVLNEDGTVAKEIKDIQVPIGKSITCVVSLGGMLRKMN